MRQGNPSMRDRKKLALILTNGPIKKGMVTLSIKNSIDLPHNLVGLRPSRQLGLTSNQNKPELKES
jgi:hypothetical protein